MEGGKGLFGIGENGSSGEGKPPNPVTAGCRQFNGSCKKTLVRHQSLMKSRTSVISVEPELVLENRNTNFLPIVRSGAWADIGYRSSMEDVCICIDNFVSTYGLNSITDEPFALYGVFDGHGGKHAADFASYHLPNFIVKDVDFPLDIERAISSAFLRTDNAFAEACSLDSALSSGTTALAALVIGRSLVVANAGDCRAVLCRRGKAVEMSRDHKPVSPKERKRIESTGGHISDGYLNGMLNVARAIGDWHLEGLKGPRGGPLSAEPELMTTLLIEDDEFLIIGCDGIWDVFRSQNAVDFARRRLQEHNDPVICGKDIVDEALKRKSGDNLSVVVVCFRSEPPVNLVAPRSTVRRSFSAEGLRELQSFLDSLAT